MNQLFLVVSIILLLFSLFISSQVKEGFTQCGGDSNYTKTDVSLSFFPEYFAQLFLSPPTSSITNNANSYQLGCAQIPSKRFIPIDTLIISFIALALLVKSKINLSKFIFFLKKLRPSNLTFLQPQNQPTDATPKKGLSILLSIPYFIFATIAFLLFIGASNENASSKKSLLVTVTLVSTIFLFLNAFGILKKKSWAGITGLILNILLISLSVYGIIWSLWIINYEATHQSSIGEELGTVAGIIFIVVSLITLFVTLLTTRHLWRLAFSAKRSSLITDKNQPPQTPDPRFPTLDAQPTPTNSPPDNQNQG